MLVSLPNQTANDVGRQALGILHAGKFVFSVRQIPPKRCPKASRFINGLGPSFACSSALITTQILRREDPRSATFSKERPRPSNCLGVKDRWKLPAESGLVRYRHAVSGPAHLGLARPCLVARWMGRNIETSDEGKTTQRIENDQYWICFVFFILSSQYSKQASGRRPTVTNSPLWFHLHIINASIYRGLDNNRYFRVGTTYTMYSKLGNPIDRRQSKIASTKANVSVGVPVPSCRDQQVQPIRLV